MKTELVSRPTDGIRVFPETHRKIKMEAARRGVKIVWLMNEMVDIYNEHYGLRDQLERTNEEYSKKASGYEID